MLFGIEGPDSIRGYTGWPGVGCRIRNLIGSSFVLKCNPTSTEDVQKALKQGRFL